MTEAGTVPLRVVLADDHAVVREGLRALVDANEGIEVVGEASNGREAVQRACQLRPDILVLDLSMPEMDGATATEEIRRLCPEVRVIALTAHDDRAHLSRLLAAGAAGYVLKRGAADELVRAIRAVADGATYVDPVLAGKLLHRATATGDPAAPADALSEREEEVLRLLAWGHSNKEIGTQLGISTKTVETYRARIADKLKLTTRPAIVRYALLRGWLRES